MEILNRGSFVTLDNREKIDQLIYTARELASEVGVTEGFRNSGQTNQQLGLEMWKGVEYVCRAHEEANIRNLFLSKFLERLRQIEKERTVRTVPSQSTPAFSAPVPPPPRVPQPAPTPIPVEPPRPSDPPAPQTVSAPPLENAAADEYLGIVPVDDQDKRPSYADECVPEYDADMEALVERLESDDPEPDTVDESGHLVIEAAQSEIAATSEVPDNAAENVIPETVAKASAATEETASVEVSESDVSAEEVRSDAEGSPASETTKSIVLADNEPYNLEGCTIRAAVQILPEESGVRKCVVSLGTHSFAPLISMSEAGPGEIIPHISAALSEAFEQYRNALPALAAEKLKRDKPTKKQSRAGSKTVKTAAIPSKPAANSEAAGPASSTPNAATDQGQRGLFAS